MSHENLHNKNMINNFDHKSIIRSSHVEFSSNAPDERDVSIIDKNLKHVMNIGLNINHAH